MIKAEFQPPLQAFIQAEHLAFEQLRDYQQAWQEHPLRIIQIKQFIRPEMAASVSSFLQEDSYYGDICGRYSSPKPMPLSETWQAIPDAERFFFYQMLDGTQLKGKLSPGTLAFLKLRQLLSSTAFHAYMQHLFDQELGEIEPVRVHRMLPQHFLRAHNDRSGKRKLAMILYLSPDWLPQYGGQLKIQGINNDTHVFEPSYNNLLLFDVSCHKRHWIEPVTWPDEHCGFARISMSSWFQHPPGTDTNNQD